MSSGDNNVSRGAKGQIRKKTEESADGENFSLRLLKSVLFWGTLYQRCFQAKMKGKYTSSLLNSASPSWQKRKTRPGNC